MADETIRDVVVKVKLDTSEAKRQAASAPGGGGGDLKSRSEALRVRTEEGIALAKQRAQELAAEEKAQALRTRMIVRANQIQVQQRQENIRAFIQEKREEEKASRARVASAAAEQAMIRQTLAQQRQQIERYSRLAEAVGNVGRSFAFLGASASESLEKAVQTLLVAEATIRGFKGIFQIGQMIRETGAIQAGARMGGRGLGGAAAGAIGGAVGGGVGAAGSGVASGFGLSAGAAASIPVGAAVVGVGAAFYSVQQEQQQKAKTDAELFDAKLRGRNRMGAPDFGLGAQDPELLRTIQRDRAIRDFREARRTNLFAQGGSDSTLSEIRSNRFRPVGYDDLNIRQQRTLRSQEIRAARQGLGQIRGTFVEDLGAGAGQQNIDRQVTAQREILALMRQQSNVARQLRDDAVARTRAVADEINQERGRRNDLRAFAGGLQAPQRAVLQQLNAKAARGDKFSDADFQLLDQVAGGQDFAEKFKRRQFIDRIPEKDLPGLVGGFLGVGEKIGGPQDQIKKLVEDQKVAADKMIQAVQEQTKAQEAETKEIADLMNIMRQSVEIRRQLLNQQAKDEAEQLQREREAAAARKAAAN